MQELGVEGRLPTFMKFVRAAHRVIETNTLNQRATGIWLIVKIDIAGYVLGYFFNSINSLSEDLTFMCLFGLIQLLWVVPIFLWAKYWLRRRELARGVAQAGGALIFSPLLFVILMALKIVSGIH